MLAAGGSACALHVVSLPADLARAEQPVSLSLDSSIGAYAEGDAPPENEFALSGESSEGVVLVGHPACPVTEPPSRGVSAHARGRAR